MQLSNCHSTSSIDVQAANSQCKELQLVLANLPPLQSMFSAAGYFLQEMLLSPSLMLALMSKSHQHDRYLTSRTSACLVIFASFTFLVS